MDSSESAPPLADFDIQMIFTDSLLHSVETVFWEQKQQMTKGACKEEKKGGENEEETVGGWGGDKVSVMLLGSYIWLMWVLLCGV